MSETLLAPAEISPDALISDALILVHKGLAHVLDRQLISADEVSDLLLDIQLALTPHHELIEQ